MQLFSSSATFEVVGIDIFGPVTPSAKGNRCIVVIVDRFTRWIELAAVNFITATTIADVVLDRIVLWHGCRAKLLSDCGAQFTSKLLLRLAKRLGVKKIFTTASHPQSNGQVERFNHFLATALTHYVDSYQSYWDDWLEAIAFAYRTSVVEAIGNTPFYLFYGRDPRLPTLILDSSENQLCTD